MRDLTNATKAYNCSDAAKWFAQVLQYNVPRGKKNRGILTVLTYKNLVPAEELTPENIKLAQYLGWCVEMVSLKVRNRVEHILTIVVSCSSKVSLLYRMMLWTTAQQDAAKSAGTRWRMSA